MNNQFNTFFRSVTLLRLSKKNNILALVLLSVTLFAGLLFREKKDKKVNTYKPLLLVTPINYSTISPILSPEISPFVSPVISSVQYVTYKDSGGQYEFQYPSHYVLNTANGIPILDHSITWSLSPYSIYECKGDCPRITSSNKKIINMHEGLEYSGEYGAVGGNIPQSFYTYEIYSPAISKYFTFTVYELPMDLSYQELSKQYPTERQPASVTIKKINEVYELISSLKFTVK